MRYFFIIIVIAAFFPALLFAQTNFKPGYVVGQSSDTTRGAIDYREWANNPESFRFKNNAGQMINYTLENATAFGIDKQDYYQRFTLPLSMNEVQLSRLPTGYDSTIATKTVFLRILTTGKNLTLYSYADLLKIRYVIKDNKAAAPEELLYHVFYESGLNSTIKTVSRYRTQLLQYAYTYKNGDQQLIAKIQRTGYNDDLISIVNAMNNQGKNTTAGENRVTTRFFAGAAYNIASFKFSGDMPLAVNPAQNTNLFPQITVGVDAFANGNVGRFITRIELSFVPYHQLKASSFEAVHTVDQQSVIITPAILYNFYNSTPVKVFFSAGVDVNIYTYRNNIYTVHYIGSPNTYELRDYIEMRKVMMQIPIKAGVTLNNKIQVYATYYYAVIANSNTNFTDKLTLMKFGINYLFGKK